MGFAPMEFDRVWTKASDFPTYEAHEETVRADMQYLYDVIKNHYNRHIRQELNAENIPFTPTPGAIELTNIQAAIEYVNQRIQDSYELNIADGSITAAKLHQVAGEEAVTTNAIADKAVTGAKIADYTITRKKIAPGEIPGDAIVEHSITVDQMGDDSVNTSQLANNCVTYEKLGNLAVKTARIDDKAVTSSKIDDGAVETVNIHDEAVTKEKIGSGAVTAAKLGPEAVESAKIKGGAVTDVKLCQVAGQEAVVTNAIRDGNVTFAKLHTDLQALINGKAPISHASTDTDYGLGTSANYGHVKLSDATDGTQDTDDGIAATPKAVKDAYDLANGKAPIAHAVNANTYGLGTSSVYGHVKLSAATDSTSGADAGIAASPSAVKAAYDLANGKAPISHASSANTYGLGTSTNYGHVKLSDSTNSTSGVSGGIAATPAAVKAAYNLANGKADASHTSVTASDTAIGHIKMSTGTVSLTSGVKAWSKVALPSGLTCNSSSLVICTPAPASYAQWVDNRIRCTAQGTNTLTFAADTNTTAAVTVNVMVLKL